MRAPSSALPCQGQADKTNVHWSVTNDNRQSGKVRGRKRDHAGARGQDVDAVISDARREDRIVLWSILGFWLVHLLFLSIFTQISSGSFIGMSARRIPAIFVAAALCYAIHMMLRRTRGGAFWKTSVAAILLALGAAAIYGAVTTWLFFYAGALGLAPVQDIGPYTVQIIVEDAFIWLYSFFSWTAFYLALTYNSDVRERERRLAQVEALAQSAQVRALRYQINPHFLFNTLNAVSSMIWERDFERAEAMLIGLSSFLRTTLAIDPSEDVTLAEEIALQRLYLEIEQTRFPDRLNIEIDIPDELADARVPTLILQPLVENAIKYAVALSKTETRIRIAARRRVGDLILEVEDDGAGEAIPGGTGVGLLNVRERLAARFGKHWSFTAGRVPPRGFRVMLGLPLEFAT